MVGDRLDTDIAGAAALGWDSLLVLTGIATEGSLADSDVLPTFVSANLSGLFEPPVTPTELSAPGYPDRR